MNEIKIVRSQLVELFKKLTKVRIVKRNKLHCVFTDEKETCVFEIMVDMDKFFNEWLKSFESKGKKEYEKFLKDKKSKGMEVSYRQLDNKKIMLVSFRGIINKDSKDKNVYS